MKLDLFTLFMLIVVMILAAIAFDTRADVGVAVQKPQTCDHGYPYNLLPPSARCKKLLEAKK